MQEFDDAVDEEYLVESEVAEEEHDEGDEEFMDDEEEGGNKPSPIYPWHYHCV